MTHVSSTTTWMCLGHPGVAFLRTSMPFRHCTSISRTSKSDALSPPSPCSTEKKVACAMEPSSSSQFVAFRKTTIRRGPLVNPQRTRTHFPPTILCLRSFCQRGIHCGDNSNRDWSNTTETNEVMAVADHSINEAYYFRPCGMARNRLRAWEDELASPSKIWSW